MTTRLIVRLMLGLTVVLFLWAAIDMYYNWKDLFQMLENLAKVLATQDPKLKDALQNNFVAAGRLIAACLLTVLSAIFAVLTESVSAKQVGERMSADVATVRSELTTKFGDLTSKTDETFGKVSSQTEAKFNQVSQHFGIFPSLQQVTGNHYDSLRKLAEILETTAHKDLYIPLITYYFEDANKALTQFCRLLEDGEFSENRRLNFYKFVQIFFNYVTTSGEIRATSIVDPGKFWKRPEAIAYLNEQQHLIKTKGIDFFRYFLIAEDHQGRLKAHEEVIRLNLEKQIKVRVVFLEDETPGIYEDVGLIDKTIAVKNCLTTDEDIESSTCCLEPNREIDRICRIFIHLEDNPRTMKFESFFKSPGDLMNFDALWNNEIIKAAETKITLLDKLSGKQI
jgi:hypothetical protein